MVTVGASNLNGRDAQLSIGAGATSYRDRFGHGQRILAIPLQLQMTLAACD